MTKKALKDTVLGVAALLVFPVAINLTAWNADGEGRSLDDPLWHRGGPAAEPVHTAGR